MLQYVATHKQCIVGLPELIGNCSATHCKAVSARLPLLSLRLSDIEGGFVRLRFPSEDDEFSTITGVIFMLTFNVTNPVKQKQ